MHDCLANHTEYICSSLISSINDLYCVGWGVTYSRSCILSDYGYCFLEEKTESKTSKPKEGSKEAPKAKEAAAPKAKEESKLKAKDASKSARVKPILPKPVKTKVHDGGKGKPAGVPAKARDKALKAKKAVLHGVHNKRIRKQRNTVHFRRPQTLRLPRTPKYQRKSTPKRVRYRNFCLEFVFIYIICEHFIDYSPAFEMTYVVSGGS